MIEVGDKSLMHHQLTALKNNGITDIVVGVGYRKDDVAAHSQKIDGMRFTFVDNPDYATTNTSYTLWMCREEMDDDFLYLNADVLFHESLITRLLEAPEDNVLALDNKRCGAEEVKAILKNDTILHIGKSWIRASVTVSLSASESSTSP
ncbi:MAG: Bifunctional IPC transferase and DIPP synthase [Candidatus Marinimicrobia bacterium]|nr:Bifunctional IPC transferase and DIPP synthase [Candidatus Neomarinimicrobiota bacterium]